MSSLVGGQDGPWAGHRWPDSWPPWPLVLATRPQSLAQRIGMLLALPFRDGAAVAS